MAVLLRQTLPRALTLGDGLLDDVLAARRALEHERGLDREGDVDRVADRWRGERGVVELVERQDDVRVDDDARPDDRAEEADVLDGAAQPVRATALAQLDRLRSEGDGHPRPV